MNHYNDTTNTLFSDSFTIYLCYVIATYSGAVLDLLLVYRQILAMYIHVIDKATSLKLKHYLFKGQEYVHMPN